MVASCKCRISFRSNLAVISKDYYQWHVLHTIDNVQQRFNMMPNALVYKLATFPFGVVVMSVRWKAVKQIICIHIFFRQMCWQICNYYAFMNITQSVVVDKYHIFKTLIWVCLYTVNVETNSSEYILDC